MRNESLPELPESEYIANSSQSTGVSSLPVLPMSMDDSLIPRYAPALTWHDTVRRIGRHYLEGVTAAIPEPARDAISEMGIRNKTLLAVGLSGTPLAAMGLANAMFTGDVVDAGKTFSASKRMAKGTASEEDRDWLAKQAYNAQRDPSISYMTAEVLAMLPGFYLEIGAGLKAAKAIGKPILGKAVAAAAKEGGEAAGKKAAMRLLGEALVRPTWTSAEKGAALGAEKAAITTAQRLGRGLARSAVKAPVIAATMPREMMRGMLERMTPGMAMQENELGELELVLTDEGDGFAEAFIKQYADNTIEAFSEFTGESLPLIGKMLGGASPKIAAKAAMLNRYAKQISSKLPTPPAALVKAAKFARSKGWSGLFGEMAEERIGGALRVAVGLEKPGLPSLEQLASEMIAFSLPGAAFQAARVMAGQVNYEDRIRNSKAAEPFYTNAGIVQRLGEFRENVYRLTRILDEENETSFIGSLPFVKNIIPPKHKEILKKKGTLADIMERTAAVEIRGKWNELNEQEAELASKEKRPPNRMEVRGKFSDWVKERTGVAVAETEEEYAELKEAERQGEIYRRSAAGKTFRIRTDTGEIESAIFFKPQFLSKKGRLDLVKQHGWFPAVTRKELGSLPSGWLSNEAIGEPLAMERLFPAIKDHETRKAMHDLLKWRISQRGEKGVLYGLPALLIGTFEELNGINGGGHSEKVIKDADVWDTVDGEPRYAMMVGAANTGDGTLLVNRRSRPQDIIEDVFESRLKELPLAPGELEGLYASLPQSARDWDEQLVSDVKTRIAELDKDPKTARSQERENLDTLLGFDPWHRFVKAYVYGRLGWSQEAGSGEQGDVFGALAGKNEHTQAVDLDMIDLFGAGTLHTMVAPALRTTFKEGPKPDTKAEFLATSRKAPGSRIRGEGADQGERKGKPGKSTPAPASQGIEGVGEPLSRSAHLQALWDTKKAKYLSVMRTVAGEAVAEMDPWQMPFMLLQLDRDLSENMRLKENRDAIARDLEAMEDLGITFSLQLDALTAKINERQTIRDAFLKEISGWQKVPDGQREIEKITRRFRNRYGSDFIFVGNARDLLNRESMAEDVRKDVVTVQKRREAWAKARASKAKPVTPAEREDLPPETNFPEKIDQIFQSIYGPWGQIMDALVEEQQATVAFAQEHGTEAEAADAIKELEYIEKMRDSIARQGTRASESIGLKAKNTPVAIEAVKDGGVTAYRVVDSQMVMRSVLPQPSLLPENEAPSTGRKSTVQRAADFTRSGGLGNASDGFWRSVFEKYGQSGPLAQYFRGSQSIDDFLNQTTKTDVTPGTPGGKKAGGGETLRFERMPPSQSIDSVLPLAGIIEMAINAPDWMFKDDAPSGPDLAEHILSEGIDDPALIFRILDLFDTPKTFGAWIRLFPAGVDNDLEREAIYDFLGQLAFMELQERPNRLQKEAPRTGAVTKEGKREYIEKDKLATRQFAFTGMGEKERGLSGRKWNPPVYTTPEHLADSMKNATSSITQASGAKTEMIPTVGASINEQMIAPRTNDEPAPESEGGEMERREWLYNQVEGIDEGEPEVASVSWDGRPFGEQSVTGTEERKTRRKRGAGAPPTDAQNLPAGIFAEERQPYDRAKEEPFDNKPLAGKLRFISSSQFGMTEAMEILRMVNPEIWTSGFVMITKPGEREKYLEHGGAEISPHIRRLQMSIMDPTLSAGMDVQENVGPQAIIMVANDLPTDNESSGFPLERAWMGATTGTFVYPNTATKELAGEIVRNQVDRTVEIGKKEEGVYRPILVLSAKALQSISEMNPQDQASEIAKMGQQIRQFIRDNRARIITTVGLDFGEFGTGRASLKLSENVSAVGKWTRDSVSSDAESLYVFTDNTDRTSGSGFIAPNSWYAKRYGKGKKFPKATQAVIRGLDNARPISTMKKIGSMADAKAGTTQWQDTDEDFALFKSTIDVEIKDIQDALPNHPGGLKISRGGQEKDQKMGQGSISKLPPRFQDYLDEKLLEIGIDQTQPGNEVLGGKDFKVDDDLTKKIYNAFGKSMFFAINATASRSSAPAEAILLNGIHDSMTGPGSMWEQFVSLSTRLNRYHDKAGNRPFPQSGPIRAEAERDYKQICAMTNQPVRASLLRVSAVDSTESATVEPEEAPTAGDATFSLLSSDKTLISESMKAAQDLVRRLEEHAQIPPMPDRWTSKSGMNYEKRSDGQWDVWAGAKGMLSSPEDLGIISESDVQAYWKADQSNDLDFAEVAEVVEEWKQANNIVYDPQEAYSRGEGFFHDIGAFNPQAQSLWGRIGKVLLGQSRALRNGDLKYWQNPESQIVVSGYTHPVRLGQAQDGFGVFQQHPMDVKPTMIRWYTTEEEAIADARAMNEEEARYGGGMILEWSVQPAQQRQKDIAARPGSGPRVVIRPSFADIVWAAAHDVYSGTAELVSAPVNTVSQITVPSFRYDTKNEFLEIEEEYQRKADGTWRSRQIIEGDEKPWRPASTEDVLSTYNAYASAAEIKRPRVRPKAPSARNVSQLASSIAAAIEGRQSDHYNELGIRLRIGNFYIEPTTGAPRAIQIPDSLLIEVDDTPQGPFDSQEELDKALALYNGYDLSNLGISFEQTESGKWRYVVQHIDLPMSSTGFIFPSLADARIDAIRKYEDAFIPAELRRLNKHLKRAFRRIHGSLDPVAPYEQKAIRRASGVQETFSFQFGSIEQLVSRAAWTEATTRYYDNQIGEKTSFVKDYNRRYRPIINDILRGHPEDGDIMRAFNANKSKLTPCLARRVRGWILNKLETSMLQPTTTTAWMEQQRRMAEEAGEAPVENLDVGDPDLQADITYSLRILDNVARWDYPYLSTGSAAMRHYFQQASDRRNLEWWRTCNVIAKLHTDLGLTDSPDLSQNNWKAMAGSAKKIAGLVINRNLGKNKYPNDHRDRVNMMLNAVGAALDNSSVIPGLPVPEVEMPANEADPVPLGPSVANQIEAWDDYAIDNDLPSFEEVKERLRAEFDRRFSALVAMSDILNESEKLEYWTDYVMHAYRLKNPKQATEEAQKIMKLHEGLKQGKKRTLETYEKAAARGLLPITMNAADILTMYAKQVERMIFSKEVFSLASIVTEQDGMPTMIPVFATHYDGDRVIPLSFVRSLLKNMQSAINSRRHSIALKAGTAFEPMQIDDKADPLDEVARFFAELDPNLYEQMPSPYGSISSVYVMKDSDSINVMKNLVGKKSDNKAIRIISAVNMWLKFAAVGVPFVSMFHPASLAESAGAMGGLNFNNPLLPWNLPNSISGYRKFVKMMKENPDLFEDAIMHGVIARFSNPDIDISKIDNQIQAGIEKLRAKKIIGSDALADWLSTGARLKKFWDGWLWHEFHPALKLWGYQTALNKAIQEHEARGQKYDSELLKRQIANYVNNAFGGQNWSRYAWANPKTMQAFHELLFAFDYTLSNINISGVSSLPGINKIMRPEISGVETAMMAKVYWPAMAVIVLTIIPNMIQASLFALFGDDDEDVPFTWMNEPGKETHVDLTPLLRKLPGYTGDDSGKRRVYTRWGKQAYEVFEGWFSDPAGQLMRKTSMSFKIIWEQATGTTTSGWKLPFNGMGTTDGLGGLLMVEGEFAGSRLATVLEKALPMSILSVLQGRPSTFIAPASKGMSQGAIITQMSNSFNAYADPTIWAKISGNAKMRDNLGALVPGLIEAADRNGYDADKLVHQARSHVLSKHYLKFFRAINAGKLGQAEEIAEGIVRLNGTLDGLNQSMKNRREAVRQEYSVTEQTAVEQAFQRALQRFE